ncbi:type VI secretion system tip protein VgrG [Pigmentibacter ruber]|uniref:type VI secretion system tip protein VgrG n=1 Tax=Pigmentibacter ruber TaxID=2683196 RepID=UPI00131B6377|nr:type VI secretion system tip protein VgrG [Pigmentibacter ruber]
MKLDIYSINKNSSGYTLKASFYKRESKILEMGLCDFSMHETISRLSYMTFYVNLTIAQLKELNKKLKLDTDKISHFFYFFKVHIQIYNSLGIPIREFSAFIDQVSVDDMSYSNSKRISFTAFPLPYFMSKIDSYRVYIDKKVEDIIKDVFKDFKAMSFTEYVPKFKLQKPRNTKRLNCVQNGETDWDFILRLIDEEDWNFIFKHKNKEHEMIIFDDIKLLETFIDNPKARKISLNIEDKADALQQSETNPLKDFIQFQNDRISQISFENSGAPISIKAFDHDHRNYGKILFNEAKTKSTEEYLLKGKKISGFDGLKKYKDKGALAAFVDAKSEEMNKKENSLHKLAYGETNNLTIYLGSLITANYSSFDKRPVSGSVHQINSYCVNSFTFHLQFIGSSDFEFSNSISMHPKKVTYKSKFIYNRNYIDGTITAKVFGEEKELNIDEDYFIKILLPWQYDNFTDKSKFLYARYMSPWANNKYGVFAIPRGIEEVLLVFEDGDPDLPIVIGGVYNHKRPAPIDIKKKKHVFAIYDQPSKNKKNNFFEMDHQTSTVNLAAAQHMKIRSFGDHLTQSKWKMEMITAKNMLSKSKEQMEFKADKNMLHDAKEHMEVLTEKYYNLKAKEQIEFKTEKNMLHESKEHMELSTQKNFSLQAVEDIQITTDKNINIKAGDEITIKVGSSVIKLDKSGNISVTGSKITLKGKMGELEIK